MEPIQFADALWAALAAVSALAAFAIFTGFRLPAARRLPMVTTATVALVALITLPGMVDPRLDHPHPCGPFAALNGVGAGSIKPREVRSCDHVHGSGSSGGL